MDEWIEKHIVHRNEHGDQDDTCRMRRRYLIRFARYCQANDLRLAEVLQEHFLAYQTQVNWDQGSRGLMPSPATVAQNLLAVRTFLRWATAKGQIDLDPTADWRLGRSITRPRSLLTRPQLEAILESPSSTTAFGLRDRAILSVMAELGLFSRACRTLDLSDLDLMLHRLRGKPLGPHLTEKLYRYVHRGRPALLTNPDEPALFLTRSGGRMVLETITLVILKHGRRQTHPRDFHKSWLAHREAFLNGRLPGI